VTGATRITPIVPHRKQHTLASPYRGKKMKRGGGGGMGGCMSHNEPMQGGGKEGDSA